MHLPVNRRCLQDHSVQGWGYRWAFAVELHSLRVHVRSCVFQRVLPPRVYPRLYPSDNAALVGAFASRYRLGRKRNNDDKTN